jgi:ElaB/YqjD/DUF883 family membrane-anchored ribosome-binding protein
MKPTIIFAVPLMLAAAACNVSDEGNTTVLSVDENRVEQGVDTLQNAAVVAADKAGNAIENAGPALENTANTISERAGRVADRAENAADNIDVDVTVNNTAAEQNR